MNRRLSSVAFALQPWLPCRIAACRRIGGHGADREHARTSRAVPALCTDAWLCRMAPRRASRPIPSSPRRTAWSPRGRSVPATRARSTSSNPASNRARRRSCGVGTSPVAIARHVFDGRRSYLVHLLADQHGDSIGLQINPGHDIPSLPDNNADVDAGRLPSTSPTARIRHRSPTSQGHELLLQATVSFCNVPNVHKQKKVNAKTGADKRGLRRQGEEEGDAEEEVPRQGPEAEDGRGDDRSAGDGRRDRHRSEVGAEGNPFPPLVRSKGW